MSETDDIRPNVPAAQPLDDTDRKILAVLVEDAAVSYAELGKRVCLSPPAAHERVKRLRRNGVINRTAALIEPKSLGKGLLAFVHVDTRGWGKTPALMAVADFPEVEEVHSVAGDACMLLKVRAENTHALEGLLGRLYDTPGVIATRSYVVLTTYLERPPQPGITREWPVPKAARMDVQDQ